MTALEDLTRPRPRRRPGPASLTTRLVVALVTLVLGGLTVAGVTGVAALRAYLTAQVDDQLTALAGSRAARPQMMMMGRGTMGSPALPSQFVLKVLASDGSTVTEQSSTLTDAPPPPLPALTRDQVASRHGAPFTISTADGTPWRVVAVASGTGGLSVLAAQSLGPVDASVNRLTAIQAGVGLTVGGLLAALAFALVRRNLRPLLHLEHAAAAVAAGDLAHRVPEPDPGTEVGRLARAFNAMTTRIQDAFAARTASEAAVRASDARLRQFVADAGHELRTPLTTIRGYADLFQAGGVTDPAHLDRVMGRIRDEATRMGQLVEDMLTLAHLDRQRPVERRPVDVLTLATDAVTDARAAHPDRDITLETGPCTAEVLGDETALRQVLGNLVGNALRHTPPGTPVQVTVTARDGLVLLQVSDHGPGMTPEQATHVFERFYRTDEARSRNDGGTGLGLAIVHAAITTHGGHITLDTAPGTGTTFTVQLPAAP